MFSLKFLLIFLFIILFIHVFATVDYWYWKFIWLDTPMHFLGGFWTAMFFAYLIYPKLQIANNKPLITFLLFISFSALIGIFWEFYEFFYDVFILTRGFPGVMQYGAADTMKDLSMDLLGGSILGVVFLLKEKYYSSKK